MHGSGLRYVRGRNVRSSCRFVVLYLFSVLFFVFFFQAEDGIRDRDVTGVQTCALPIFEQSQFSQRNARGPRHRPRTPVYAFPKAVPDFGDPLPNLTPAQLAKFSEGLRSEERRVGKECRAWWWSAG